MSFFRIRSMDMKIGPIYMMKGATAYEFQIGPFWLRICHLQGGDWDRFPFRKRVSYGIEKDDEDL